MDTIYDTFCELVEIARKKRLNIGNVLAPAFFLESVNLLPEGDIRCVLPFDEFWVSIDLGKSQRLCVFVRNINDNRFEHWAYGRMNGKWLFDDMVLAHATVVAMVAAINNASNERIETGGLRSLNAGRAKSKAPIGQLSPFIRVGPVRVSNVVSEGGGSPKRAHERRQHKRVLRSGKEVIVRQCSIHGGSDRPRDYRVMS